MKNNKVFFSNIIFYILIVYFFSSCSSLPISDLKKGTKLARKASHTLTDEEEYFLGRAVAANILTRYSLWKKRSATDYINKIGNALVLKSDRPQTYGGYFFAILNTGDVNAWSAPGGIVFLTRGLLRLTANEDEIAAVIAHEISHVVAKDASKAIKSERLKNLGMFMTKKSVESKTGSTEVDDILNNSVLDITGTLMQKGYSRSKEKKADLAAIELLIKTGYNPGALLSILEKFGNVENTKAKIFSEHPTAKKRIVYTKKKLSQNPATSTLKKRIKRFKKFKSDNKL